MTLAVILHMLVEDAVIVGFKASPNIGNDAETVGVETDTVEKTRIFSLSEIFNSLKGGPAHDSMSGRSIPTICVLDCSTIMLEHPARNRRVESFR